MNELKKKILGGGIAVIPTDTLYGLVAQALNMEVVSKIYSLKKRSPDKPFIILISSLTDVEQFGISLDLETKKILETYWPGKVSVILPISNLEAQKRYEYLHRGTNSLAFRLPNKADLISLLKETGPLIAPSANPQAEKPAETIGEAQNYFKHEVDIYMDGGILQGEPSTLVEIKDGNVTVLRKGVVDIVLP
ncbi:MAG: hypothetical protein RJA61_471 [Candidatus Parcubacteria bacterium]|jgi:L-threonylcarbamoyladenylate synthase